MIVVAVVAILSAIAYPSYQEYVRRGHRAEARAGLLQAAQWMERAATAQGTYPLQAQFPAGLQAVPNGRYAISLISTDGASFTLTATPQGGQAGDRCGAYTLSNTGLRGANGSTSGAIVTECWGK
ncbi:type IV pilin protein [Vandammella animalimorsus]|uniref:Type IV pilin protein n=2 Tax=Vandammella animalimorsus TaxID=2029117 RepID=A0A3M6R7J8_9BURK|nr:type IV pilin protein [Vandammella animalimorsus]